MMVTERNMDVNQEAKDYLAQFSVGVTGSPPAAENKIESMLDTWTREKYKSKHYGKKSSQHHSHGTHSNTQHNSFIPKEWRKSPTFNSQSRNLSSNLPKGVKNQLTVAEEMFLMNPENNIFSEDLGVEGTALEKLQDTYMNEEAFLEQLLQNDTDPKNNHSKSSKKGKISSKPQLKALSLMTSKLSSSKNAHQSINETLSKNSGITSSKNPSRHHMTTVKHASIYKQSSQVDDVLPSKTNDSIYTRASEQDLPANKLHRSSKRRSNTENKSLDHDLANVQKSHFEDTYSQSSMDTTHFAEQASSNSPSFVAGQHVSNKSRHAVLRRGVLKEDFINSSTSSSNSSKLSIKPGDIVSLKQKLSTNTSLSNKQNRTNHSNPAMQQKQEKANKLSSSSSTLHQNEDSANESQLLLNNEEGGFSGGALEEMQPICQKCGWHMTATLEDISDAVADWKFAEKRELGNPEVHNDDSSFHILRNKSLESTTNTESGEGKCDIFLIPHEDTYSPQKAVTASQVGYSAKNSITYSSSSTLKHSSSSHPDKNNQFHSNNKNHHSNNSSYNHSSVNNAPLSHLTTSKHCHSRTTQTDPNLLSQDLSVFAEVTSLGSDNSFTSGHNNNVNLIPPAKSNKVTKFSGENNRQVSGSIRTRGKPPSGRYSGSTLDSGTNTGFNKTDNIGVSGSSSVAGVSSGITANSGNKPNRSPETIPVIEAAKSGRVQDLETLLSLDNDLWKITDVQGNSLLHITAESGHQSCVQYIATNFPVLCPQENKAKFTPAALSIKVGNADVLEWLLDHTQARDEILPVVNKKSLLHHAAKFGQDSCLRILLEKMSPQDRSTSCCDSNGNSPAHVAAKHGNLMCLQSLVEYGVDATKANKYGHSPCYYADFSNHRLCAGYLMVVETCLNLAKKLIRLEKSMEQLSNSLAKFSDNQNGVEVALNYNDYNADRSSATSSVEDDGTRDEAWQLLCRKFEEASKRLVVFRTQNRAIRPLRPSKLALLALAQTKEETQAAMSVVNKLKTSSLSANDIADDISTQDDSKHPFEGTSRSKSAPDLPSRLNENHIASPSNTPNSTTQLTKSHSSSTENIAFNQNNEHLHHNNSVESKMQTESAFVITGIPTVTAKNNLNKREDENVSFEEFSRGLQGEDEDKLETKRKISPEIHTSVTPASNSKTMKTSFHHSTRVNSANDKKIHRRSSSVGDIVDVLSDELEYHLKTRVVTSSGKDSQSKSDSAIKTAVESGNVNGKSSRKESSNNSHSPPPLPPRMSSLKQNINNSIITTSMPGTGLNTPMLSSSLPTATTFSKPLPPLPPKSPGEGTGTVKVMEDTASSRPLLVACSPSPPPLPSTAPPPLQYNYHHHHQKSVHDQDEKQNLEENNLSEDFDEQQRSAHYDLYNQSQLHLDFEHRLDNRQHHPYYDREDHQLFFGENEQTSDFFEELSVYGATGGIGRYDSDNICSDIDAETLQKILDKRDEIMRCGVGIASTGSTSGRSNSSNTKFKSMSGRFQKEGRKSGIRTPVKLELTPEDFNETYARKSQDGDFDDDEMGMVQEESIGNHYHLDTEDFSEFEDRENELNFETEHHQHFKRVPLTVRVKYGDNLNKSTNNSHSMKEFEEMKLLKSGIRTNQKSSEVKEELEAGNKQDESFTKPWYELTDEEEEEVEDATKKFQNADIENDEHFTLL